MLLFIITKHQIFAKTSGVEKKMKKKKNPTTSGPVYGQALQLWVIVAVCQPTPESRKKKAPLRSPNHRNTVVSTLNQEEARKKRKLYGSTPAAPTRPPDGTCSLRSFDGPLVKKNHWPAPTETYPTHNHRLLKLNANQHLPAAKVIRSTLKHNAN